MLTSHPAFLLGWPGSSPTCLSYKRENEQLRGGLENNQEGQKRNEASPTTRHAEQPLRVLWGTTPPPFPVHSLSRPL